MSLKGKMLALFAMAGMLGSMGSKMGYIRHGGGGHGSTGKNSFTRIQFQKNRAKKNRIQRRSRRINRTK